MTTRLARLGTPRPVLIVGLIAIGACTDPSAYASPSSAAAVSPTPRPTQAVPSRPAPSRSPAPSPTSSLSVATPLPHSDLEALLPDFANRKLLSKQTPSVEDLAGNDQTRLFIQTLLATLGRSASDLDLAVATGDDLAITALRVKGAPVDQVADAVVDALLHAIPGGAQTRADVDGRPVRRLRFANPGTSTTADQYVFTNGDVVFVASASGENGPLVQRTIRDMFGPKLQDVLPAQIDGTALDRASFPAEMLSGGGDMCSFVCPYEMPALAKELGVGLDKIDMAVAYSQQPPGVAILAIRVAGVAPDRLVAARIASTGAEDKPWFVRKEMTLGGKDVTFVDYAQLPSPTSQEFLYASGDTLFTIRTGVEVGAIPPIVEKAIAALP